MYGYTVFNRKCLHYIVCNNNNNNYYEFVPIEYTNNKIQFGVGRLCRKYNKFKFKLANYYQNPNNDALKNQQKIFLKYKKNYTFKKY